MKLHGTIISPNVRKVVIACMVKGIEFDSNMIVPGPELKQPEFLKLNPLGMIPVLEDEDLTIGDSNIIIQYLDDKHPNTPLLPSENKSKAKARWLSEFAGSALFPCCAAMFREVLVNPNYFKQPTNQQVVDDTVNKKFPPVLDYLELQMPEQGLLFGDQVTLADISIASMFITANYGGYNVDVNSWPKLQAYLDRVLNLPEFIKCLATEKAMIKMIMG